jgi:alanine dehydrogenase
MTGRCRCLKPMSEVAGRMSVQVGAHYLEKEQGGRGVLLGGVPGVAPARVTILGGGIAGVNAAQMAVGMRADVTIYDISNARSGRARHVLQQPDQDRLRLARDDRPCRGQVGAGDRRGADPGAAAPKLVTRDMLKTMKRGSVLVDIAIDQGGCFETSRPTTHEDPVYVIDGIIHYCVANMPGAVARTSAFALNNATLPFVLKLAGQGAEAAMKADPHLANGLNVSGGQDPSPRGGRGTRSPVRRSGLMVPSHRLGELEFIAEGVRELESHACPRLELDRLDDPRAPLAPFGRQRIEPACEDVAGKPAPPRRCLEQMKRDVVALG